MGHASMVERLVARLTKVGVSQRKANELAKEVAPSLSRVKETKGITDKLADKLQKAGCGERKAMQLAKALAPTVRAAIKVKLESQSKEQAESEAIDETLAPVIANGFRLRMDLPTVDKNGEKGVDLLRVMHGISTFNTYLVAAVKGEDGIVAVRELYPETFNVKFFPSMEFWGVDKESLSNMGAEQYLDRRPCHPYERMHMSKRVLEQLLFRFSAEKQSRTKKMLNRFKSITVTPLLKAFSILHQHEFGEPSY